MPRQFIYLHGFASSPQSRKATFFAERLREIGRNLIVPELEQDPFEGLTIGKQLAFVRSLMGDRETVLIGSSLGGYLATLLAARNAAVRKVLLLAPAFDFAELWAAELGPKRLFEWKQNGTIDVFHYGAGRALPLRWEFMADAMRYPLFPNFEQPGLIFHGERDSVVPLERSARYAAGHPNVRLVALPSGHELTDVLDRIWQEAKEFLIESEGENRC